ncbi:MAG: SGNH/GDSL hydrolase family protein [Thaumarchaeota archaeon]|nr:SGNH/GDSL hydrolase family protein [Nitrososphaerota archaeon]
MPVRVSYKKQFLVLTMFLLVILSVIEVWAYGYDYFNPTKCEYSDPIFKQKCLDNYYLIWYQDPVLDRAAFEPNQHMQTININNDGFRGSEIQKEKPDDTYRIIMVGGSTTFGLKMLSEHTIPAHLQEKFNQLNLEKRVEVINAGIHGYNSNDELNLIKKKIVYYDPDLVIIYDGSNDIFFPYDSKLIAYDIGDSRYIYRKYFQFYKTLDVINNIISEEPPEPLHEYRLNVKLELDDRAKLWKNNISTICEIGNQNGFKTLIFLQPFLGTGNQTVTERESRVFNNQVLKWFPNALVEYSFFTDRLDDLNHSCTGTFDLRNIFDNSQREVFFDKWHHWDIYNEVLADEIFDLALPLIEDEGIIRN